MDRTWKKLLERVEQGLGLLLLPRLRVVDVPRRAKRGKRDAGKAEESLGCCCWQRTALYCIVSSPPLWPAILSAEAGLRVLFTLECG